MPLCPLYILKLSKSGSEAHSKKILNLVVLAHYTRSSSKTIVLQNEIGGLVYTQHIGKLPFTTITWYKCYRELHSLNGYHRKTIKTSLVHVAGVTSVLHDTFQLVITGVNKI